LRYFQYEGCEFGLDGAGIVIEGSAVVDPDTAAEAIEDDDSVRVDFYFFQSKTSERFDYGDISKFFDAIHGFFTNGMQGESDQLDDLIAAKGVVYEAALRNNPTLNCFFISTGNDESVDRIEKLIEASRARLDALNLFDRIDVRLVGAKALQGAYRAATSSNSQQIKFPKSITLPEHPSVNEAHIGYIDAKELLKLATGSEPGDEDVTINQSVFFDNVRDFNPDSEINKSIMKETNQQHPNGFIFRNNGVTVIAKKIKRTGDRFRAEDYQIVNGCQTSNILLRVQG
jgi:hypothetical protein